MKDIEMPDCCEKECEVTLRNGQVLKGMIYTYSDFNCETYIEVGNTEVYLSEVEKVNIVE